MKDLAYLSAISTRLNFDPGKTNKIFQHSSKEQFKISKRFVRIGFMYVQNAWLPVKFVVLCPSN